MGKRLVQISLLVIIFGLIWSSSLREVFGPENSAAGNYDRAYTFYVQYGNYRFSHTLYTSVPPSLYDYYRSKSRSLYSDSDYSKFVTPDAVRSIAESIKNGIRNKLYSDEEFANVVLMVVRQVQYVRSNVKYPAETIVDNSGNCDELSLLAASIMKAGGLDVVLLYYKGLNPRHMNVGVYLPYTPVYRTWWMAPQFYEYNDKKYWIAECTPLGEWKVGDLPSSLVGAEPRIISLENCEESSPAQVSSSLDSPLNPSSISITLSSENSSVEEKTRTLNISGSIVPAYSGQRIVMYVSQDRAYWNTFTTVFTDNLGNYSLTWNFTSTGTYYIRTSWSGVSNYAGSDSETLTVFISLYKPLDEFEVPEYYWGTGSDYTSARASAAAYKIFINQGVKEFLKINLLGTGVFLSGEFIILRNTQTIPRMEQTITIPSYEQLIILPRSRRAITITQPAQTITIQNIQFGFILRRNGGNNYSVSVRGLGDSDISQLTIMDASMVIRENTWYSVVARISENETTAELYDKNATLLKNITNRNDAISISELRILMAYDNDTVIAFKNLKVETLDQPTQTVDDNYITVNGLELLPPYIGLTILLAAAVATIVYVKKRKRARSANYNFYLD
jgi:hypothetical protein